MKKMSFNSDSFCHFVFTLRLSHSFLHDFSMIYGMGTDLVQISRIAKTFSRYGNKFVNRILGPLEMQEFSQYNRPKEQFLSSRYFFMLLMK